ncbi:unnamed protein product [Caenorhabditis sp. 36 PRJEB53466]|nr:unnamed protein product [Caenorhabditis sp. 36 PRJEB53466]
MASDLEGSDPVPPPTEYGKKSWNLEESIQRIKERISNLMISESDDEGLLRLSFDGNDRQRQMVHMKVLHQCTFPGCNHPGYKCTKALSAHIKSHHSKFLCDKCNEKFLIKNELLTHTRTHHPN